MTSCFRRFGITLAFLGFASILPATVGAQPPVYLTQWGSGGNGDGQFLDPQGVATDPAGNVYVVDRSNQRIQKFTNTGTYLTKWGGNFCRMFDGFGCVDPDGPGPLGLGDGQFANPWGVATDAAGNVYVADTENNRIQKFTSTGTYLTQWGSLGFGDEPGRFYHPTGVATDAAGNVYVADRYNFRIQKFTDTGTYLAQWGNFGSVAVATDTDGDVYVADIDQDQRIQKFTGTGTYVTQWGSYGSGNGQFYYPYGVATDAIGNVYVADSYNERIQKFTSTGTYVTQWGSFGSGNGEFKYPIALATDAVGNIYVVDQANYRIQKFGPAAPTPIVIAFDFTPNTLNLASQGLWITGFLEPPSPHAASDIDISSIRLNGTVPVDPAAPTALGDHNGNGVPDLMVKFNRAAVQLTVSEGDNVPVVVTGMIGSQSFSGTDYIRAHRAVVSAPAAGSHLAAGSVTQVRWQTPSGVTVESVALLQSLDGGSTWSLIVRGQPNTGSYDWTVPNVGTGQAKVAVVLVASDDETGYLVDGVLGVSEAFSIDVLVGVGRLGSAQLALRGVTPNPAHELNVNFSLKDSKAATLALFDVSGRQMETRRVEGMGPGWHTVELGGRSILPAGLYVIRLTQDGRSLTTRAAVVR